MASTKLLARSGLLSTVSVVLTNDDDTDYASGDLVGGKISLLDATKFTGGGGLIQSVMLTDKAKLSVDKDVFFFSADPAASTFSENLALNIADADLINLIGIAQIKTWALFSENGVGFALDLAMPFVLAADGTTLFAAVVERGAANYVSTTDLCLKVTLLAG